MWQISSGNQDIIREWYISVSSPEFNIFDQAFHEAKLKFTETSRDPKKLNIINSSHSLQDVQDAVNVSMAKYESQQKYSKARRWLQSFSQRVHFYGTIIDVLVSHHPEYVSLVWGAMKFLFTAVINHEKTTSKLAKAFSQIADTLPQIKLASILFPTERMKNAIVDLNTYILRFLTRAHKWHEEGTIKHMLHSITQPVELRYDDIIAAMTECSATVRLVAEGSHQLELRQMHGKIDQINTAVSENALLNSKLIEVEKRLESIITHMSLQSSSTLDTNHHVTCVQFSEIMQVISHSTIMEPPRVLEYLLIARRRQFLKHEPPLSSRFIKSPRLKRWDSSASSDISIAKGTFRSRQGLRAFCVDMISQLQSSQVPVLFAMKTPHEESTPSSTSTVDVIKYLVRQGLVLQKHLQTEKSMSLRRIQSHDSLTEDDWFRLLESVVHSFEKRVYIIVDLELLTTDLGNAQGFNWVLAFVRSFDKSPQRGSQTLIKVLLVSYTLEMPFELTEDYMSNYVVFAKIAATKGSSRKSRGNKGTMR